MMKIQKKKKISKKPTPVPKTTIQVNTVKKANEFLSKFEKKSPEIAIEQSNPKKRKALDIPENNSRKKNH